MIHIDIHPDRIAVTGHANTGPPGRDLVCCAVSVLAQTLEASIRKLTDAEIQSHMEPGEMIIRWNGDLPESAQLLVDSFFIGICGVAEAHPECIQII